MPAQDIQPASGVMSNTDFTLFCSQYICTGLERFASFRNDTLYIRIMANVDTYFYAPCEIRAAQIPLGTTATRKCIIYRLNMDPGIIIANAIFLLCKQMRFEIILGGARPRDLPLHRPLYRLR